MGILKKILSGDDFHKTRLHDAKGNLVRLDYAIIHGFYAITTGLLRIFWGYRPVLPWIPYSAIKEIEKIINKHSIILEFGSGMSTIWLARKCDKVYSVEDSEDWFDIVKEKLERLRLNNVIYEMRDGNSYIPLSGVVDELFDFIMIDGLYRSACLKFALQKLKPNGYLYLDDTDMDMRVQNGDMRIAEDYLRGVVNERGGQLVYFTDFSPTQFFVKQGLLARIP
jgi:16S rRNA G966 N2-methylase RsmD